jgi:hypothetical protein
MGILALLPIFKQKLSVAIIEYGVSIGLSLCTLLCWGNFLLVLVCCKFSSWKSLKHLTKFNTFSCLIKVWAWENALFVKDKCINSISQKYLNFKKEFWSSISTKNNMAASKADFFDLVKELSSCMA